MRFGHMCPKIKEMLSAPFNFHSRKREVHVFRLLQKAYIHARYKDVFTITGEEAGLLQERVKLLLEEITDEFKKLTVLHSS